MNLRLPTFVLLATTLCAHSIAAPEKGSRPNVILMVADDLDYNDLGCDGATKIATPRVDSLARDGVRFTDAHSFSGICMPSRYSILTRRFPFRIGRSMGCACCLESGQHTNLANLDPERLKAMHDRFAELTKGHKQTKDSGTE